MLKMIKNETDWPSGIWQISHNSGSGGTCGKEEMGRVSKACEARGLPFSSSQITIPALSQAHICMHWSGKRINPPTVHHTRLTGAVYRLVVKFIILLVSNSSSVNLCVDYQMRYVTIWI
jgi:hypothetical protein